MEELEVSVAHKGSMVCFLRVNGCRVTVSLDCQDVHRKHNDLMDLILSRLGARPGAGGRP